MADHEQIRNTIQHYSIPKGTVARLAEVWPQDFSGWLTGRQNLSETKTRRIATLVADIVKVIEVMPMGVDLRNPSNVQKLITAINDAEAQLALFEDSSDDDAAEPAPPDLDALRVRPA